MITRLRRWADALTSQALLLWLAARDSRTPLLVKCIALFAAAYAFSPIDLIPDFIPVLGLLDDLVILPLAIGFALKRIPAWLIAELRERALVISDRPTSRIAAAVIAIVWGGAIALLWLYHAA